MVMNQLMFFTVVCVISLLSIFITIGSGQDFGYEGNEGPGSWGNKFNQCVGKYQSPIDIEEMDVEEVDLLPIQYIDFHEKFNLYGINNGHTVQFKLNSTEMPTISGGPLIGHYRFEQMHFHWGLNDDEGSETKINNQSFPMELHLVFFSTSYGTIQRAIEKPDGLAVLSFMISKSADSNENFTNLVEILPKIQKLGATASSEKRISLDDVLIPKRPLYYTYFGSLTTPPCSEGVTWIEFRNTIPLSHKQIQTFRELNSLHGKLLHNYRPIQPLHGRVIRTNKDIVTGSEIQTKNSSEKDQLVNKILLIIFNILLFINKRI